MLFVFPFLILRRELIEPDVARVARGRNLSRFKRREHGAAGLLPVGAVVEAALAQKRLKFGKIALQVFLVEMLGLVHVEGREARRVRDKGFVSERIELDVAGGVPSAAELVADLADFDRELGRERIEKARFADAGVPREGAKLSRDGLPQRGDSFAGLCACAQDGVGVFS